MNRKTTLLTLHNEIPDFASKLLMSDEAHFELNGTANKQNCKFWGIPNPRQTLSSLHICVRSLYGAETMDPLQQIFPDRIISKYVDFNSPARSPDLTALDFFQWGYM